MKFKYKTVKTLEERKQEYREIKQKNQNKIAIITILIKISLLAHNMKTKKFLNIY